MKEGFRYLSLVCCLLSCAEGSSDDDSGLDDVLENLTQDYSSRVGVEGIGRAAEARFLAEGSRVLVLDRFPPHLRLFTAEGEPLWSGGLSGGGPAELRDPQALGTNGGDVVVLQPGMRISRWALERDSLRFVGAIPLSAEYAPLGIVSGCSDDWLLYARNDSHFVASSSDSPRSRIDYLHRLRFNEGAPELTTLWSDARDITAALGYGHSAALIGRSDTIVAVWHRSNAQRAGQVMQFDCDGRVVATVAEASLVTGGELRVQISRPAALEWTSGVLAVDGGMMVAMHRYFSRRVHRVPEPFWKTEVFGFRHGRYVGSVVLSGQWQLMDFHEAAGALVMSEDPVPHFIRVPAATLYSYMH